MSKDNLVAEFPINFSSGAFIVGDDKSSKENAYLSDFETTDVEQEPLEDIPTNVENLDDDPKPEQVVEASKAAAAAPVEPDYTDDYTNAAILASALNDELGIYESDVPKDLKAEDLLSQLKKYLNDTASKIQEEVYETAGEASKYLEFILNGGSEETVRKAAENRLYSQVDVEAASEDELEDMVKAMYLKKGITEKRINRMIEDLKDNDELREEAKMSKSYHSTLEDKILKEDLELRKQQAQQDAEAFENTKNTFKTLLEKGSVAGLKVDKDTQKAIMKAIYEPTELVTYKDNQGNTHKVKDTKYNVLYREFNSKPEQQLAFVKLLLDGFDFTKLSQQAEHQANNNLISKLNESAVSPRRNSSSNAYIYNVD